MKLKIIGILLLLSIVGPLQSQSISYGMEFGFTASFFDQKNAPYGDPTIVEGFKKNGLASFELGVIADYAINDALGLISGFFLADRGGSYRTKNPNFVYVDQFSGNQVDDAYNYLRYKLTYLEVPVSIKLDLMKKSDESLNIFVGATPMLNIGSKLKYNVFEGSSDPEENWEKEKREGAEPFVLGLNAGIEWRGGPLILYGKYLSNLTPLYNTEEPGYENYDVNMTSISIGMGFSF